MQPTCHPRLAGRIILVSGAAKGIGRAICLRLAGEGARVACADLDATGAAKTAQEIGSAAIDIACDVTDAGSARNAVEQTVRAFGAMHGLINNAAASSVSGTVVELDRSDWDQEIAVSLTGAFLMSKFAVPPIAAAGGGSIIHVALQFGRVAIAGSAAYCAAKAALVNLAKVMALDHAAQRIRVNALSPGAVATHRLLESHGTMERAAAALVPKHPIGRIAQPEEIAAVAAFLMSEDANFITGSDLLADGGYTAWWGCTAPMVLLSRARLTMTGVNHHRIDERQKMGKGRRLSGWIFGEIVDTPQLDGCSEMGTSFEFRHLRGRHRAALKRQ